MTGAERDLAGKRILVVEDEFFIADDLERELAAVGAEIVGPAATIDRAAALVDAGGLDAAVLDVNLRGSTVYPIADRLTAAGVPFIFATGYDAGVIPAAYRHIPRCEKPVSPQLVAEALRRVFHAT